MLVKYIRLIALVIIAAVTYYVYDSQYQGSYVPPLDPTRPVTDVQEEMKSLWMHHYQYFRDIVDSKYPHIINNACNKDFNPKDIKNMFHGYEYKAHLKWVKQEFRRLEALLKQQTPYFVKETYGSPPLRHENSELIDTSPELQELRRYVDLMEHKVETGDISSNSDSVSSTGSLILLTAAHNASEDLLKERDTWAQKHGQKHVYIDLDKYMAHRSVDEIGVSRGWLHLAAMEEVIHRHNSDWIWYLRDDLKVLNEDQDVVRILNNIDAYQLDRFPLQSSHPDLKGGVYAPHVKTENANFIVNSNNVAFDTSSLFIRNNDVTGRYLQYWSTHLNMVDDGAFWTLDDQFDGKSEEAFAHMYRVLNFMRSKTIVVPKNTIAFTRYGSL